MSEFLSFYFLIFVNLTLLWLLSSFIEKKLTKTLELEAASNPKTSKHWLKLINHFLKLNQVQKARESSAKALKEIPFEAERDRLNIWTALAALEIDFGTAQSFGVALQNCVARCEPHFAYQRVIEVLVAKGRFKTANSLFSKLIHLNKHDPAPWISYARFLFRHSAQLPPNAAFKKSELLAPELASTPIGSKEQMAASANVDALLKRALQVFGPKGRTEFLLRFARVEFSLGSRHKARQTFDGVVAALPRSARAWATYLDAEIEAALEAGEAKRTENGGGEEDSMRGVFERALAAEMPLKKVKFVFAKVLEFYRMRGDGAGVERIKGEARAYGERARLAGGRRINL